MIANTILGLGDVSVLKRQKRPLSVRCRATISIISALTIFGCTPQPHRDTRVLMGTFVEVVSHDKRAARIAFDEISRLEALFSKYRPDSEIARLNRAGTLRVSPETFELIRACGKFSAETGGAFDITVGPLMDAWGFTDKKHRVPPQQEIGNILARVGSDKITLDETTRGVSFSVPGVKLDLGGAAKGYALDRAAEKIKEAGIDNCLINAGGQVYCIGTDRGRPWKVAIKDPSGGGIIKAIEVKGDRSVATSGNYEQYFTADGKRYSHIIDPRTGYPASAPVDSVTIMADSALAADLLATAACVTGDVPPGTTLSRYKVLQIQRVNTPIGNPESFGDERDFPRRYESLHVSREGFK